VLEPIRCNQEDHVLHDSGAQRASQQCQEVDCGQILLILQAQRDRIRLSLETPNFYDSPAVLCLPCCACRAQGLMRCTPCTYPV
jgi:hypothetical protein